MISQGIKINELGAREMALMVHAEGGDSVPSTHVTATTIICNYSSGDLDTVFCPWILHACSTHT